MRAFIALIFTALVLQTLSRYFLSTWTFAEHFFLLGPLLLICVPVIVFRLLEIPVGHWGLGFPSFERRSTTVFGGALLLVAVCVPFILLSDKYIAAYPLYADGSVDEIRRLLAFVKFTASTLVGWEFLHRSFLFLGGAYLLRRNQISEIHAFYLSALFVLCFEVLFHLTKPPPEAFGMIFASPIFSWLTWRTRSIWPALILHLWVEVVFVLVLVFLAS